MARTHLSAIAAAAAWLLFSSSAGACPMYLQPEPEDAKGADAVVTGRVTELLSKPTFRWRGGNRDNWWKTLFPRDQRYRIDDVTDRVRLTLEVRQVVKGETPGRITIDWFRETNNGPPSMMSGEYLFALRKSPMPTPQETYGDYAVLQSTCRGALVLRIGTPEANAVRAMFGLPAEEPQPEGGQPVELEVTRDAPPSIWFLVGGGVVAGLMFAGILLARRRRRPRVQKRP